MATRVVEVEGLTKQFGAFTAVNAVSFHVEEGEIFGFLGPNGAGKSTTIKMLCGILAPTAGTGRVLQHDIVSDQESIKKSIGYMSQRFSLYEDLTVRENLEFFGSVYGLEGPRLRAAIKRVRDLVEIEMNLNMLVRRIPVGIRQRLALGGALLHDPPILFLDEPTSGVDPVMRRAFWDIIYRFTAEGKTVFVTTHYMDEAEHCSRIALIIDGAIIALGTPDELKRDFPYHVYSVSTDAFLTVFERLRTARSIIEPAIFGRDIHVICEGSEGKREAEAILGEMGISQYHIRRIVPTLEDVFVISARRAQSVVSSGG